MNRTEKETLVAQLHDTFGRATVALVATNRGLTVGEATALRRSIRAAGGEMRVAKHTLTRLALADTRYGDLTRFLEGPRGLVFGFDDPVGVAKVLVDFAAAHKKLEIDGGALEGQVIGAAGVDNLSKMPDLPALQARIARQVLSPATRIASQVASPATRIAGAIAARVEQLEGDGAATDSGSSDSAAGASGAADSGSGDSAPGASGPGETGSGDSAVGDDGAGDTGSGDSGAGEGAA